MGKIGPGERDQTEVQAVVRSGATSKWLPSYGRKRGRKVRPLKRKLVDENTDRLIISLPRDAVGVSPESLFDRSHKEYWLEIGFGSGEHMVSQAENNRDIGIIGSETYDNGVANAIALAVNRRLENIRIYNDDARFLLESVGGESIHKIFILFPDPWPKQSQKKRRIINKQTLIMLHRILVDCGRLRIATDCADYAKHIYNRVRESKLFKMPEAGLEELRVQPEGWVGTKYESKALMAGKLPYYMDFYK